MSAFRTGGPMSKKESKNYGPLSEWLDALISGKSGSLLFCVILREGYSCIMPDYVRKQEDFTQGDFVCVRVCENQNARPEFKARHVVIEVKRMENPPGKAVFFSQTASNCFSLRTTAEAYATTEHNGSPVVMLQNAFYGNFIDLGKLLQPSFRGEVDFDFKCCESPMEKTASIFIPSKIYGLKKNTSYLNDDRMSNQRKARSRSRNRSRSRSRSRSIGPPVNTVGFVGYEDDTRCYVWSADLRHDAILFNAYKPGSGSLLAKWIKLKARKTSSRAVVAEPVTIIDDVLPTKIRKNVPEVLADVVFDGKRDGGALLFWNKVLGDIVDEEGIIENPKPGESFEVWTVRHKKEHFNSRWKISYTSRSILPNRSRPSRADSSLFAPQNSRKVPEHARAISSEGTAFRTDWSSDDEPEDSQVTEVYSDDEIPTKPATSTSRNHFSAPPQDDNPVTQSNKSMEISNGRDEANTSIQSPNDSEVGRKNRTLIELVTDLWENPEIRDTVRNFDERIFKDISAHVARHNTL